MKNTISLKLNRDFRRLYSRGKRASGRFVTVYAASNRKSINRLGLTVSKTVGKAHTRNRVKRLIRECYRKYEPDFDRRGYDFVIAARSAAGCSTFAEMDKDIYRALVKLGIMK